MRKSFALTVTAIGVATALLGTTGVAFAADQQRLKTRAKDASCTVAALKTRTRIQDGSCVAALKTRKRDRLKDGSCTVVAKQADRTRTRDC